MRCTKFERYDNDYYILWWHTLLPFAALDILSDTDWRVDIRDFALLGSIFISLFSSFIALESNASWFHIRRMMHRRTVALTVRFITLTASRRHPYDRNSWGGQLRISKTGASTFSLRVQMPNSHARCKDREAWVHAFTNMTNWAAALSWKSIREMSL